MTPQIAPATSSTTLPPAAGTTASPSSSTGFWSHPLQSTNKFLTDNQATINLLKSGAQMMGGRRQTGSTQQLSPTPQLPVVTPPPQLDRLAFLRAFGMQG